MMNRVGLVSETMRTALCSHIFRLLAGPVPWVLLEMSGSLMWHLVMTCLKNLRSHTSCGVRKFGAQLGSPLSAYRRSVYHSGAVAYSSSLLSTAILETYFFRLRAYKASASTWVKFLTRDLQRSTEAMTPMSH